MLEGEWEEGGGERGFGWRVEREVGDKGRGKS